MTGCVGYQTASLDYQETIVIDDFCLAAHQPNVNLYSSISDLNINNYLDPKKYFASNADFEKDQTVDAYEQGYKFGISIGEIDTNPKLWVNSLDPVSGSMDAIYNYRSIMYHTIVLPKRLQIIQGGSSKDKDFLTQNGYRLNIIGEFDILDSPLTWREWFPTRIVDIKIPTIQEFDVNSKTRASWVDGLEKGYLEGVCLTYLDFKQSMINLDRDFRERFTYVLASRRGLTQAPELNEIKIPLDVKNKSAEIDTKIIKVTDKGDFVESEAWGEIIE